MRDVGAGAGAPENAKLDNAVAHIVEALVVADFENAHEQVAGNADAPEADENGDADLARPVGGRQHKVHHGQRNEAETVRKVGHFVHFEAGRDCAAQRRRAVSIAVDSASAARHAGAQAVRLRSYRERIAFESVVLPAVRAAQRATSTRRECFESGEMENESSATARAVARRVLAVRTPNVTKNEMASKY